MSDRRSGSSGALVGGFLLGSAVGAAVALLVTPKTGKETRRILKKSADALPELAEDLSTSVQVQADKISAKALRNWDGTLGRLREAIAAGVEASRQESRRLETRKAAGDRTEAQSTPTES